jgi:hypothetical protein
VSPGDGGLLPGMNVAAQLPADKAVDGTIVPETAVVRWQGKNWVYIRTDEETFARREIATDLPAETGGYIVRDIPPNAQVVLRGAQTLLSEELKSQQPQAGDEG